MFNFVFRRISLGVLLLMIGTMPALVASEDIQWSKSVEESLSKAAETGKPIMMDFYTDW
jgi:thiol:disulfide interchange protein